MMNKIKEFLRKYWKWLVIGILIGLLSGILIWLFWIKDKDNENLEIQKVKEPYSLVEQNLDIELETEEKNFNEEEPVFKVSLSDSSNFTNLIEKFFDADENFSPDEDINLKYGDNTVSYISNTNILSIFPTSEGLSINMKVTSVRDLESFFLEYFGLRSFENDQIEEIDGNTRYSGYFNFNNVNIGSSYLNGYSYQILFNRAGNLMELKLLLLSESDLTEYQHMPTIKLSELLQQSSYYMKISNSNIDESFYEVLPLIRTSAKLEKITIKNIDNLYIFNNFENPLILPTFRLLGDGKLVDSQENEYWADSQIFICAINPEYLDREEEEMFFNPVPYVEE